jgi:hypothetical protein
MKSNKFRSIYYLIVLCCISFFASSQPVIGGFNVYYGSLHNHTSVSDGTGTPDQAYKYARNTAHLDFFGLADHSNMISSTEWTTIKNAANSNNQDGAFAAFYGFEWTTFLSYGHVAVVNTDDYCSNTSPTNTFTGLLSWVNARTGIAFFNHPGWDAFAVNEFNHFTNSPSDKFVGMELWNDMDGFSKYYYNDGYYSNDGNKGYYDEALIRGWKSGAAGADDNHDADWGTSTGYRVGVLANTLSRTSILDAFRARRFFATIDKNIALSFKINNAEMGSTISGGTWNFVIDAKDADNESFTQVVLMKNGAQLQSWSYITPTPLISEYFTCNSGDYFYVRVKEADGNEAISSPIFISGTANLPPTVALTAPVSGATYLVGEIISMSATAADPDGTIARVEFYQGSNLLGSDINSPYEYQWSGSASGTWSLTAKAIDNLGASTTSAPVSITVTAPNPGVVNASVASGNDDAEEYSNGTVILNSDDIDLVYDSKTSGNQTVGLLFRNLNIPSGSTITKAYIQFTANKRTTNTCSLLIRGEANSSAAGFSTSSKNLSTRTKTTAGVTWVPLPWKVVGSHGATEQTKDISFVVQEIVNLQGWSTASNLVILITGSGTRTACSYETSAASVAVLHVEYTSSSMSAPEIMKSGEAGNENLNKTDKQLQSVVDVLVYPNPVTDILKVKVNGEAVIGRLTVLSVNGATLLDKLVDNQVEAEIDCNQLIPGIYVLSVSTDKGIRPVRFIRQ